MNNEFIPPRLRRLHTITRRHFLHNAARFSLGAIALQTLLGTSSAKAAFKARPNPLAPKSPPHPAKAKAVIYLSMSGAPPSLDWMCASSCARISSPGLQCVAIAT